LEDEPYIGLVQGFQPFGIFLYVGCLELLVLKMVKSNAYKMNILLGMEEILNFNIVGLSHVAEIKLIELKRIPCLFLRFLDLALL
jgi:hypothetical protein